MTFLSRFHRNKKSENQHIGVTVMSLSCSQRQRTNHHTTQNCKTQNVDMMFWFGDEGLYSDSWLHAESVLDIHRMSMELS